MNSRSALILFFLIFYMSVSDAQQIISGKITDSETAKVLVGANIYINNTTIRTISGHDGSFRLDHIPEGKQELVVSFVGYDAISYPFSSLQLPLKADFKMKQKNQELKEVTIKSDFIPLNINDPEVLKRFRNAFLGVTSFSEECIIRNIDDIQLRLNKNTQEIFATAKKPIVVVNKALGYIVEYELQSFRTAPGKRYFFGKAFFQDLNAKGLSEEIKKSREAAYYGSITHFLRSVYNNTDEAEGFEMRSIERGVNTKKKRALAMLNTLDPAKRRSFVIDKTKSLFGDSSDSIRRLLFEKDYLPDVLSKNLVKSSSIKGINEKGETIFKSPDTLLSVVYKKPLLNPMRRFVNRSGAFKNPIASIITLSPNKEIALNAKINGLSNGLFLEGFFSFAYGISTMLPENYEP